MPIIKEKPQLILNLTNWKEMTTRSISNHRYVFYKSLIPSFSCCKNRAEVLGTTQWKCDFLLATVKITLNADESGSFG